MYSVGLYRLSFVCNTLIYFQPADRSEKGAMWEDLGVLGTSRSSNKLKTILTGILEDCNTASDSGQVYSEHSSNTFLPCNAATLCVARSLGS